jgi:hypothetical protein
VIHETSDVAAVRGVEDFGDTEWEQVQVAVSPAPRRRHLGPGLAPTPGMTAGDLQQESTGWGGEVTCEEETQPFAGGDGDTDGDRDATAQSQVGTRVHIWRRRRKRRRRGGSGVF